jgi:hypothetical protein
MKRTLGRLYGGLLTLGLLGLIVSTAQAVERPFKLVEQGKAQLDLNAGTLVADGKGNATHLGRFSIHRELRLAPAAEAGVFEVNGNATLTAANGDELRTSITGTLNLNTGHAFLNYEWTGGTGRFENATGKTTWLVEIHEDATYDVVAKGVIDF